MAHYNSYQKPNNDKIWCLAGVEMMRITCKSNRRGAQLLQKVVENFLMFIITKNPKNDSLISLWFYDKFTWLFASLNIIKNWCSLQRKPFWILSTLTFLKVKWKKFCTWVEKYTGNEDILKSWKNKNHCPNAKWAK